MKGTRRAPGEGSVFKLQSGKWRAQVRYRLPDGKMKPLTKTCRTKTEAVEQLRELNERIARMGARGFECTELGTYLDEWHKLRKNSGRIRASTAVEEKRHLDRLKIAFGTIEIIDLQRRHVRAAMASLAAGELSGKVRTQGQVLATLRKALSDAVREERIDRNPCDHVEGPRRAKASMESFSQSEVRTILEELDREHVGKAPDQPFAALVHVLLFTGVRVGEALALTWGDVNFRKKTITVDATLKEVRGKLERHETKTGKRRVIRLPDAVLARLKPLRGATIDMRRREASVFRTSKGTPLRQSNLLRRRWHPMLERIKMERCGFHKLRHTHASLLIAGGVDLVTLANRLGHSDSSTTLRVYAHPFQERDAAASESFEQLVTGTPDTKLQVS
jgi:integrase